MFHSNKNLFFLILILILSFIFRIYNLNWDQNTHLHPDERFLTMVETALSFPKSISEYLDTKTSPLNPYNRGYGFFVYGTFPIFLTKYVGHFLKMEGYDQIHFVGRFLSGLFDLGTTFLLFLIGKKIWNEKTGLLAAFLYGTTVLAIQLSHFFAVDTFLNFFIVLSFYFLILFLNSPSYILNTTYYILLFATSLGLALACKINAILFLPIIFLGFLLKFLLQSLTSKNRFRLFILYTLYFILLLSVTFFSFRFFQPYTFIEKKIITFKLNPQFLQNLKTLESFNNPNSNFPPSLQWVKTQPYIYPLKNMLFWGMGFPLGVISFFSLFYKIFYLFNYFLRRRSLYYFLQSSLYDVLIIIWVTGLFFYQGGQFIKALRYFFPIYPFLSLLSANFSFSFLNFLKSKVLKFYFLYFIIFLIYPLAFFSIYLRPLTRVSASEWIYKNIPAGSFIVSEHWDDPLPVSLPNYQSGIYKGEMLPLYDQDTPEKWQKINEILKKADYYILSSNRLYRPIIQNHEKYPIASKFYQELLSEKLGFKKIITFTSRPTINLFILKIIFNDDDADETFTVYDHPKVIILENRGFKNFNY